jgi:hypothetical protein
MKKILIIITLVFGLIACENQQNDFPDFEYTAGYFAYQNPVRTIILGNYIFDNSNDLDHKFLISATIGGVYENKTDREFTIEVAPELCENALFASTLDTIRVLPPAYYTLSSDKITIPAGQFHAGVEVQLTDAFFNDPKSLKLNYVIPVKIISSLNIDSVLRGKVNLGVTNADRRKESDWAILPKDYVMFAVKFINPYHGKYLHRGTNVVKDGTGTVLETNVYSTYYVEKNEIWSLVNTSLSQVTVQGNTHSTLVPGFLKMNLTFAGDSTCAVTEAAGSTYTITGSGKFRTNADSWGNKQRDAIYLNYQLTSGGNTLTANDTLVIRDRSVVMELYKPLLFTK